jgi:hypothetical protein
MAIKASDLIDELTLAYSDLKATAEAWQGGRIEKIAKAVEDAVGIGEASTLQSALLRLQGSAEDARIGAWSAVEALEEARRIVRAREASGFTV